MVIKIALFFLKFLILEWRPGNAKRKRGRTCRTRWRDTMEREANLAGMDQDLESMAADRAQWWDMFALMVL